MGDIANIMPALHTHVAGFSGTGHGSDWAIEDKYLVYVLPAKLMAMTVIDLLAGNGETAKALLDISKPPMTKGEYLAFMRRNAREELFDGAAGGYETSSRDDETLSPASAASAGVSCRRRHRMMASLTRIWIIAAAGAATNAPAGPRSATPIGTATNTGNEVFSS
ncbi:MAG: hypothetical protein WEC79_06765 [Thermomicrobiales bacterium]